MVVHELMDPAPSSTTLLYHILVQDGAVPPGFQQEVRGLGASHRGRCSPRGSQSRSHVGVRRSSLLARKVGRSQARSPSREIRGRSAGAGSRGPSSQAPRQVLKCPVPGPHGSEGRREIGTQPLDHRAREPPQGNPVADGSVLGVSTREPAHWRRSKGKALFGPELEASSASSLGWLFATSSLTRQPSASSQNTCRCVCRSRATGAPSKDHITRWFSLSPWLESRHKTVSLTVSCTTSCIKNSWQPGKASAQSPHSHARGIGTPGRLCPYASLPSGLRLVAPDPGTGPYSDSRITGASSQAA